ncbi:MAG: TonB-dependent receptor, partial [Bacteroidota bacterium]
GAVSSVKSEDLVERPVPTIDQALQGRVAGATIRTNSAAPGGGMNIVIRGVGSINSSTQPLYILNGIPVGDVDNIPAEDVESVEILKDASATAIYGARGANGVVLVTTKTGKAGKPILSYNNRFSFETADTDLNLMNGPEFAQFYTEWELANGVDPANVFYNGSSELNPLPENAGNTNWFDEISRTGLQQNHNLSLSGGSERSTYAVSLNYLDHRGILEGSDYSRLSLNLNNTYEVKDWINVGLNIVVSSDDRNSVGENATLEGDGFSAINAALKMMPTLPIFDENGDFVENLLPGSQSRENPVAAATQYLNQRRQTRGVGKLFLEFTPFDGFKFKTSIGANLVNTKFNTYQPRTTILGGLIDGEATNSQNISSYFINEYIATYDKTFARHNIGVLAGFTLEGQTTEGFSNEANGFFTDAYENNNIGAGTNILGNSFKNKWTIASFISRVNYSYDNKYLLTLTGRYDGSSRFAEDNQWGFFPSAAVAWKLSEEPFFPQSNIVTFVKLRASYGSAGNSNIGLYNSLATFNLANYTLGTALAPGVRVGRLSNPNFGWESLVSSNVGLDIGLINDRVDLTVDVYKKTTQDLIASASLIETSGLSNANINVGELENRGLELGVEARVISDGDFKWFVSGNISFNSNEVTKWNGDPANDWRIGNPIGVRRAIEIDGIIRTPEELEAYPIDGAQLGEFRQVDQNGDSLLNGDDQVIVFDPTPQFTYGFSHDFSYKAFSLSFAFYGFYGGQIYNESNRRALQTQVIRNNMSRDLIDNYWTPENPNAEFPALDASTTSNNVAIEDGSFLRLQNILLAYKFPKVKGVKSLSVFASAQNVFTWTKYTGFDPDANSTASGGPSNIGEDRTSFPIPRSYTVGVQVSF